MSGEQLRKEWSERHRLAPAGTAIYDVADIIEKYGEPADSETDFGVIRKITFTLDKAPEHGWQTLEIKEVVDPTDLDGSPAYRIQGGAHTVQYERYLSRGTELDIEVENSILADLSMYISGTPTKKWQKSTRSQRKEMKKQMEAEGFSPDEISFFVKLSKSKKLRQRFSLELDEDYEDL
jgi:hypothetical protein